MCEPDAVQSRSIPEGLHPNQATIKDPKGLFDI